MEPKDWFESASKWDVAKTSYRAPVSAMRLGEVGLVFHPAELFSYHGLAIRRDSPFANTLVVGYTNDFIGYVTGTYNHVGSRYTQLADQEPGTGTLNLNSFGATTIGGPRTQSTFTFDPLLPAYDLINARIGIRHAMWDIAFYVNNLTDEQALLSLDRERGFRARVAFLTNQPRTFGLTTRFDF